MKDREHITLFGPIGAIAIFTVVGIGGSIYDRSRKEPEDTSLVEHAKTVNNTVSAREIDSNVHVDYSNYTKFLVNDADISFEEILEEANDSENYLKRNGDFQTYLIARSISNGYEYPIRTRDDLFRYIGSIETKPQAMAFLYAVTPEIVTEYGISKTTAEVSHGGVSVSLIEEENGKVFASKIVLDNSSQLTVRIGDRLLLGSAPSDSN